MANGPVDFDNPAHRPVFYSRVPFAKAGLNSIELACSCRQWTHPTIYFRPADEEQARDRARRKQAVHAGAARRAQRAGSVTERTPVSERSGTKLALLVIAAVAVVAAVFFFGTRPDSPGDVAYGPGWNGEALESTSESVTPERTRAPSRPQRTRSAAPDPQPVPQPEPEPESSAPGLPQNIVEALARVGEETGYTLPGSAPGDAADLAISVCERVADGFTTFEAEYAEALADGAPPAAASRWNSYLEGSVCPALG